jgi:predicted dehydrogenase
VDTTNSNANRRDFLKTSGLAVVGSTVAASLAAPAAVHAGGSEILKVGVIGCGSRGSGAASDAMKSEDNVRLTAMADMFPDALQNAKRNLKVAIGDKFAVRDEHCFSGFDAYKQLLATDVDVVLLCTPPHFRPLHLQAAIAAGKHVFCEKPVAVDGPGLRSVLESVQLAKSKNLSIVSGLCWRYDLGVRATMDRILGGAIGEIVAIQENYLAGTLWLKPRQPQWTEMEYQIRNWLYYTWLSGDHIVEQHVHSLDKALWLMGDKPPAKCFGLGGRQVRTDPDYGHIYDHFATCYEWPNGVKTFAYTRQMAGCKQDVDDYVLGTKGRAVVLRHEIEGPEAWKYKGPKPSMYEVEHQHLFAGIRSGKIINNGEYMVNSTLMAIMGREACYTGDEITSEAVLESNVRLGPDKYEFGSIETADVPMPGLTRFS